MNTFTETTFKEILMRSLDDQEESINEDTDLTEEQKEMKLEGIREWVERFKRYVTVLQS